MRFPPTVPNRPLFSFIFARFVVLFCFFALGVSTGCLCSERNTFGCVVQFPATARDLCTALLCVDPSQVSHCTFVCQCLFDAFCLAIQRLGLWFIVCCCLRRYLLLNRAFNIYRQALHSMAFCLSKIIHFSHRLIGQYSGCLSLRRKLIQKHNDRRALVAARGLEPPFAVTPVRKCVCGVLDGR